MWRVWSSRVGERICLFDMLNHYIVCPDSGSVRLHKWTISFSASVRPWKFFIRCESRIMWWWTFTLQSNSVAAMSVDTLGKTVKWSDGVDTVERARTAVSSHLTLVNVCNVHTTNEIKLRQATHNEVADFLSVYCKLSVRWRNYCAMCTHTASKSKT